MTLPASGSITWNQICTEFGLTASTAIWPAHFYGLGGAPASGNLSFSDFYGLTAWAGPTFVGASTPQDGTTASSISWPSGHATNDIAILVVTSANEAIAVPTGFTQIVMSAGQGTAAAVGSTRIGIFWCRATSAAMAAVSIADSGDNNHAAMVVFRGCITTGNPYESLSARATNSPTASTSLSLANANSTAGTLRTIVACVVTNRDSINNTHWSGWANANLTSVTEREDDGSSSGVGSNIGIASGNLENAGAIGTFTGTMSTSQIYEAYSFALIGAAGTGGGGGGTNFPASLFASGMNACSIRFDNNGSWYTMTDGGAQMGTGVWLVSGVAADYTMTYHTDSGSAATGLTQDTALNLGTDRTISMSTGAASKDHNATVTIRKASDSTLIETIAVNLWLDGDGGGGTTMTL